MLHQQKTTTVTVTCHECKRPYTVTNDAPKVACPHCGTVIVTHAAKVRTK